MMGPVSISFLLACLVCVGLSLYRGRADILGGHQFIAALLLTTNQVVSTVWMSVNEPPVSFYILPVNDLVTALAVLRLWVIAGEAWKRILFCVMAACLLCHVAFGLWLAGFMPGISKDVAFFDYQLALNVLFALALFIGSWMGGRRLVSDIVDLLLPSPVMGRSFSRRSRARARANRRGAGGVAARPHPSLWRRGVKGLRTTPLA